MSGLYALTFAGLALFHKNLKYASYEAMQLQKYLGLSKFLNQYLYIPVEIMAIHPSVENTWYTKSFIHLSLTDSSFKKMCSTLIICQAQ